MPRSRMPRSSSLHPSPEKTPWSRPGWIASVGLLVLIVVAGMLIIVLAPRHRDATAVRPPVVTAAPSATPTPKPESGCELSAAPVGNTVNDTSVALTGTRWLYEGASSYPVSTTYGPGRSAPEGYRYCYQHSAGGALFAAANTIALSLATDQANAAFAHYIIGSGPYHDQELTSGGAADDPDPSLRLKITGFRILEYEPSTATIDLAVRTTTINQSMELSFVFDLVWQHGDWRYSADVPEPLSVTQAADGIGYTSWGDS